MVLECGARAPERLDSDRQCRCHESWWAHGIINSLNATESAASAAGDGPRSRDEPVCGGTRNLDPQFNSPVVTLHFDAADLVHRRDDSFGEGEADGEILEVQW